MKERTSPLPRAMWGTRRFKDASGTLTLTAALTPVLFDASGNPKLYEYGRV
jgi:hypothetical protein